MDEVAGLGTTVCCRIVRPYAGAEYFAGIGIHAGRSIYRNDWSIMAKTRGVDKIDGVGKVVGYLATEANAENCIYDAITG